MYFKKYFFFYGSLYFLSNVIFEVSPTSYSSVTSTRSAISSLSTFSSSSPDTVTSLFSDSFSTFSPYSNNSKDHLSVESTSLSIFCKIGSTYCFFVYGPKTTASNTEEAQNLCFKANPKSYPLEINSDEIENMLEFVFDNSTSSPIFPSSKVILNAQILKENNSFNWYWIKEEKIVPKKKIVKFDEYSNNQVCNKVLFLQNCKIYIKNCTSLPQPLNVICIIKPSTNLSQTTIYLPLSTMRYPYIRATLVSCFVLAAISLLLVAFFVALYFCYYKSCGKKQFAISQKKNQIKNQLKKVEGITKREDLDEKTHDSKNNQKVYYFPDDKNQNQENSADEGYVNVILQEKF